METITTTKNLIEAHSMYLTMIRGYAKNTTDAYKRDLVKFVRWMKDYKTNARWSTITRDDIDAYMIHLSNEFAKPSTINRNLSAISSIYKFFKRQGLEVQDPTRWESRKKIAKTEPNTINVSELREAWENADAETALALKMLYETGIRAQELLDITTDDINRETWGIRINGKGSKERTVFILPDTLEMVDAWLQGRRGKLFTFQDQRALRRAIYEALEPFSHARQLSPHAIRHTMATEATAKGVSSITLAKILGHESVKTTQKYVNLNGAQTREQWLTFAS